MQCPKFSDYRPDFIGAGVHLAPHCLKLTIEDIHSWIGIDIRIVILQPSECFSKPIYGMCTSLQCCKLNGFAFATIIEKLLLEPPSGNTKNRNKSSHRTNRDLKHLTPFRSFLMLNHELRLLNELRIRLAIKEFGSRQNISNRGCIFLLNHRMKLFTQLPPTAIFLLGFHLFRTTSTASIYNLAIVGWKHPAFFNQTVNCLKHRKRKRSVPIFIHAPLNYRKIFRSYDIPSTSFLFGDVGAYFFYPLGGWRFRPIRLDEFLRQPINLIIVASSFCRAKICNKLLLNSLFRLNKIHFPVLGVINLDETAQALYRKPIVVRSDGLSVHPQKRLYDFSAFIEHQYPLE